MNHATTLWNLNRYSEADAQFGQVQETMLAIPAERLNIINLGQLYGSWSGLLFTSTRFRDAIDRADDGLSRIEPYLRIEPNDAGAIEVALALHGNRALALAALGRHSESAKDWARVVELSGERVPTGYRILLALELLHSGEIKRALDQAQLAKANPKISGDESYNLACLYALAAAAVRKNRTIAPDEREQSVKAHIADALQRLKAASAVGLFLDPAQLKNAKRDPDLEILRDLPEFQVIILDAQFPANPFAPGSALDDDPANR